MILRERDQVVETVSSKRPNQPFTERIRTRSSVAAPQRPHAKALDGVVDLAVEGATTVVDEAAVSVIEWDRLAELLADPCYRGTGGDVGLQDLAAGRPVNFMVFESVDAATSKAPNIIVPSGG